MKKIILLCCLLSVSALLSAQSALKPVSVNVFKNGTYFIAKEGTVSARKGFAELELPKDPLLGTYWLNTTKEAKISKVYFLTDTIKKTKTPQNFSDIFKGSIGKKVRFTYYYGADKNTREISGLLSDYYETSSIAKIKLADNKTTYCPVSSVVDFTIEDAGVGTLTVDSMVRVAKIYFDKNVNSTDLHLVYMQSGIQWFPSYNVKVINENDVQLEMKALVENYSEDIDDAELTLTVGNPQFFYGQTFDPIYNNYLTSLYDIKTATLTSTPMQQMQTYSNENSYVATDASAANNQIEQYYDYSTEGEKTNDLYMYKLGSVSLPKQSKTSFQIFSVKLPYKDVYEVSLGDIVNYSYYSYISNDPEKRFDVFHSLQLQNTTTYPFTTAPVFVQNENLQPLAQDRIKYTPTGANVSVQLSKAGDVVVKNKEEEVKKEENVKKIGKTFYNKVTIRGTIYIENLQNKKITLKIKKELLANVINVSDDGKIEKNGRYSYLNPYESVNWEIPCGSKDKKTVTYEYEVFAPSNSSGSY